MRVEKATKESQHSLDDDVTLHQHVVLPQPLNLALPHKPHQGKDPLAQLDALKTNQAPSGDTAVVMSQLLSCHCSCHVSAVVMSLQLSEHGTPHDKMHTHTSMYTFTQPSTL